jgi:SHS2 domain-containing protein
MKDDLKFMIVEDGTSADFVVDVYGETLNKLFANCAEACFFAMTNIDKVRPVKDLNLIVDAENIDELLYNFIAELIYLKDIEKMFFSRFDVNIADNEKSLKAVVAGDTIDYINHEIKSDVKAITYHDLQIKKSEDGFVTRVMLDL